MKLTLLFSAAFLMLIAAGCSTPQPKTFPEDAFIVTGKMNPVSGSKVIKDDACWVLEAGTDLRLLKYYQIVGPKDMVDRLKEEDMMVTIRIVSRPLVKTNCPVGAVAEVLEIIEARSKKN